MGSAGFTHDILTDLGAVLPCIAVSVLLLSGCTPEIGTDDAQPNDTAEYKVFALNRRGMAFPDNDFAVSAIFPPANFLIAQVVRTGSDPTAMPELLDDSRVELRYSAVADPNGSINTVSSTKTNFWTYADTLYHFYSSGKYVIEPDQGVRGVTSEAQWVPGFDNAAQPFERYDNATSTFTASYIPIVPLDDVGTKNYFPLYNIEAVDKATQQVLASTVVPLPMAEPMRCELCHANGGVAADELTSQRFGGLAWSENPDAANNAKENIAILHSLVTGLNITVRQPYLCAECHYSPIADPDGRGPVGDHQTRRNPLSISIHAWHALDRDEQLPIDSAQALIPENDEASCKICHGGTQPYARGPMHRQGIVCQDCHGGLIAVGKSPLVGALDVRTPFADEPRCESCHTGDEVDHLGDELVLRKAFEEGDPFATPRITPNRRFAERPGGLYRSSIGHGGMTCASCHGSPHAEWPVLGDETHDNEIATQLQGHAGSIIECDACHEAGLPLSLNGPHGLHNVNDSNWVLNHGSFFKEGDPADCQACHGVDLQGGRLAKAAAPRTFTLPNFRQVSYAQGQAIGCADCHVMP